MAQKDSPRLQGVKKIVTTKKDRRAEEGGDEQHVWKDDMGGRARNTELHPHWVQFARGAVCWQTTASTGKMDTCIGVLHSIQVLLVCSKWTNNVPTRTTRSPGGDNSLKPS
jgi:hypothetical protein